MDESRLEALMKDKKVSNCLDLVNSLDESGQHILLYQILQDLRERNKQAYALAHNRLNLPPEEDDIDYEQGMVGLNDEIQERGSDKKTKPDYAGFVKETWDHYVNVSSYGAEVDEKIRILQKCFPYKFDTARGTDLTKMRAENPKKVGRLFYKVYSDAKKRAGFTE